jgi:hypothetical protein
VPSGQWSDGGLDEVPHGSIERQVQLGPTQVGFGSGTGSGIFGGCGGGGLGPQSVHCVVTVGGGPGSGVGVGGGGVTTGGGGGMLTTGGSGGGVTTGGVVVSCWGGSEMMSGATAAGVICGITNVTGVDVKAPAEINGAEP